MLQQFRNIDSAFRHIKWFSIVFLIVNLSVCVWVSWQAFLFSEKGRGKVYVLSNGKLLEAFSADRKEKLPVEIRDHVSSFHRLFFTLEPDEQFNRLQLSRAFYLCDSSARDQYKLLESSGYYAGVLAGNISQRPVMDSIHVNVDTVPWRVNYYGKLIITRSTSIVTRSLVSTALIRDLGSISDNNPHGFLMEGWKILDNRDLDIKTK